MPGSRGRSALAFKRRRVARDEVWTPFSALGSFSSVAEAQGFCGATVGAGTVGGCLPAAPLPAIGRVIASVHDQARDRPIIVSKRLPEIVSLREGWLERLVSCRQGTSDRPPTQKEVTAASFRTNLQFGVRQWNLGRSGGLGSWRRRRSRQKTADPKSSRICARRDRFGHRRCPCDPIGQLKADTTSISRAARDSVCARGRCSPICSSSRSDRAACRRASAARSRARTGGAVRR
jgi:hypothetical protein